MDKGKNNKKFQEHDFLKIILDSIADGVFTIDPDFKITSMNKSAEKILGIKRSEAIGKPCYTVFRTSICPHKCALRETMETGKEIVNLYIDCLTRDGKKIPLSISTALLRDKQGNVVGGVETFRDLRPLEELRKEISARYTFEDIVSKNHQILRLFHILPDIAESNATVLIQGPSGSGKELFARAIHNLSPRRAKPFLPINCGALPDTLLESELFGYVRGAFTGADRNKPGKIAQAEGGTILLDEVSETSPAFQVKLLRFLENHEYSPLGSTEIKKADVRVISATNKDLKLLVNEGKFREDLYYRLNVITITLPPLKERKEDIPLLVEHFIDKFNAQMGKHITGVSEETLDILMRYDFPGNVRELENIIEHSMILCRGERIEPVHLPEYLYQPVLVTQKNSKSITKPFHSLEAEFIRKVLEKNNWNIRKSALELGIHRTTLWRKMQKFGIKKPL